MKPLPEAMARRAVCHYFRRWAADRKIEFHTEYTKLLARATTFTVAGRHVWEFTMKYGGRRVWVASMPDGSVKVQREDMPPEVMTRVEVTEPCAKTLARPQRKR